ncbi:MAG: (Fe-S)-binding protein, partial [Anaerolineales bacterium]
LYPDIGQSVVRVLNRAGIQVEVPPNQTCCGQPAFNAGMRSQARQMAIHTIEVFEATQGTIIIPSGSCCSMIRHSYPELFSNDPIWLPRAKALAERCFELSEFLVDVLGITDLGSRLPSKITYHSSCHLLRELGVNRQPRLLLSSIHDAEIVELPGSDECCGFGGVFSVEYPEISAAMLERKIENIKSTGADLIVSCDAGCITNINGGLQRKNLSQRVVHIAEVLDSFDK